MLFMEAVSSAHARNPATPTKKPGAFKIKSAIALRVSEAVFTNEFAKYLVWKYERANSMGNTASGPRVDLFPCTKNQTENSSTTELGSLVL